MTELAFLLGAPGSALFTLGAELDREKGVRVLLPWNAASTFARLREATIARATSWRGPLGRERLGTEASWIDRALALVAPELIVQLVKRESAARGELALLALGHFDLAGKVDELAELFPEAKFVWCESDGCVPAVGRIPDSGDPGTLALAGLDWARAWNACTEPLLDARERLGSRLFVLRAEELVRDADGEKRRLCAWLGIQPVSWCGTRPWTRERLSSAALQGFASSPRALRSLARLGRSVPEVSELASRIPELFEATVRESLMLGELDRVATWLELASAQSVPALQALLALFEGDLSAARGEREAARRSWLRATELDPRRAEPFERIFADRDAREAFELAARARGADESRIRGALARWLVARGLDAEAAEILARVEHRDWAVQPDVDAGSLATEVWR